MDQKKKRDAYKKVSQIDVFLWDTFVGSVALDPRLNYYVFAYDKSFGKSGIELSPLHMPLNDREEPFIFTDLPIATYKRLPAMLADALPDDFGNALIELTSGIPAIKKSLAKQRVLGAFEKKIS